MFDRLLPLKYTVDGNRHFIDVIVPRHLQKNLTVYDVGGGKNPCISQEQKEKLSLVVIGVDIDEQELRRAPQGIYDEIISADVTQYQGRGDADLVVCQALLEHVKDIDKAFAALSSIVKPEGTILIFVPSKNALYARLNRMLPESLKRKLLYFLYPQSGRDQGFPSYYNKCSPKDFYKLARQHGLRVAEAEFYYMSAYFSFFFPAFFIWRIWVLIYHLVVGEQAAETFSMALTKEAI